MKSFMRLWPVVAAVSIVLTGCSPAVESVPDSAPAEQSQSEASQPDSNPDLASVRTSNLVDAATREEVFAQLRQAGISQAALDEFAGQVERFNGNVPTSSLISEGFVPLNSAEKIDKLAIIQAAQDKAAPLTNCRITTFTLGRELVTVGKTDGADDSQLFFDAESIDTPPAMFNAGERDAFMALYGRVPTAAAKDSTQHAKDIAAYFADHQITFTPGKASMVSVFMHDNIDPERAAMFVGHVGVLVENEPGKLLFVEKLAFDQPYRASWFESRDQLVTYLRSMYDDGPDQDYGQPVIMENDRVLS
ncbi:DUF4300 family protein [Arcanobacterium phocae]|uniref:DUF4300 family protein n=1 Tax=Arcanobacterium phocae TaxID=131112 RepID=UPI001C0EB982|nr:DUF4300 family protein [Arcanobacterium phocae]